MYTLNSAELGVWGEAKAAGYLKHLGWRILGRNIKEKFGEIDILTRDNKNVLVFMEVKTLRAEPEGLQPEDHLTEAKLFKMKKMAEAFVNANPRLVHAAGWRIDLIAISVFADGHAELKHYENLS